MITKLLLGHNLLQLRYDDPKMCLTCDLHRSLHDLDLFGRVTKLIFQHCELDSVLEQIGAPLGIVISELQKVMT